MLTDLVIVVVEDNVLLREEMQGFLTRPGSVAHGVDCGEDLNVWLQSHTPDIVILDVNLPYEDGYSIARRLRDSHPDVGIIMLTARVRHSDRTQGYESGVDVYLTKPTHTNELIAVIENFRRRLRPIPEASLRLEQHTRELLGPNNARCQLTLNEQRLLELLILSPSRAADLAYLLEAMAGRDHLPITREALAVLISRLRHKIKDSLAIEHLLVTDRRLGYRLSQPIRLVQSLQR